MSDFFAKWNMVSSHPSNPRLDYYIARAKKQQIL